MVFHTHGAENDSKYRDVAPLNTDVFETRTVTGRRMHLLLARFDLNQSIGKPLFLHTWELWTKRYRRKFCKGTSNFRLPFVSQKRLFLTSLMFIHPHESCHRFGPFTQQLNFEEEFLLRRHCLQAYAFMLLTRQYININVYQLIHSEDRLRKP